MISKIKEYNDESIIYKIYIEDYFIDPENKKIKEPIYVVDMKYFINILNTNIFNNIDSITEEHMEL